MSSERRLDPIPLDELAAAVRSEADPIATARDASSVIVTRRTPGGDQILMLSRPRATSFAAGAQVFPGGSVNDADLRAAASAVRPASWPEGMTDGPDVDQDQLAAAALRELFEEVGLLCAQDHSGRPCSTEDGRALARELALGHPWAEALARVRLRLDLTKLTFFARWITPTHLQRRFDTRFFLLDYPAGQDVIAAPDEVAGWLWTTAQEALASHRSGAIKLVFVTRALLEQLAGEAELEQLRLRARRLRAVKAVRAELVRSEDGWLIRY